MTLIAMDGRGALFELGDALAVLPQRFFDVVQALFDFIELSVHIGSQIIDAFVLVNGRNDQRDDDGQGYLNELAVEQRGHIHAASVTGAQV